MPEARACETAPSRAWLVFRTCPSLIQLLPGFGHLALVLRAVHSLAKFIDIGQHFLLFVPQAFEFPADCLAVLLGFGFLKRRLQFLEPLIDVKLTAGEFLQPVEHLKFLALFRSLLLAGLALSLVAILRLLQFELIQLRLKLPAASASSSTTASAAARDLVFPGLKFEQRLISGLFRRERVGEWFRGVVVRRLGQIGQGFFHFLDHGLGKGLEPGNLGFLAQFPGLIQCLFLGFLHDRDILLATRGRLHLGFPALQFPGRVDDLFLKFGELLALASLSAVLLLLLGLATGRLLAFAKDLFEVPDFGKIHVTGSAADLAIGSQVVGPDVVSEKFIGLGGKVLDREKMIHLLLLVWAGSLSESTNSSRARRACKPIHTRERRSRQQPWLETGVLPTERLSPAATAIFNSGARFGRTSIKTSDGSLFVRPASSTSRSSYDLLSSSVIFIEYTFDRE